MNFFDSLSFPTIFRPAIDHVLKRKQDGRTDFSKRIKRINNTRVILVKEKERKKKRKKKPPKKDKTCFTRFYVTVAIVCVCTAGVAAGTVFLVLFLVSFSLIPSRDDRSMYLSSLY